MNTADWILAGQWNAGCKRPQRSGWVVFWKWRRLWGQPCLGRAWESDGMCNVSESSFLEQLSGAGSSTAGKPSPRSSVYIIPVEMHSGDG